MTHSPERRPAPRRRRALIATAAVVVGLSIPVTGAGSAIAAPHPPSLTSRVAATAAQLQPVLAGKRAV